MWFSVLVLTVRVWCGRDVGVTGASSDILPVHKRPDPLHLVAVERSTADALRLAQMQHTDVDIFELHDAYTIMACVSLESAGFVPRGQGTAFAADGHLAVRGWGDARVMRGCARDLILSSLMPSALLYPRCKRDCSCLAGLVCRNCSLTVPFPSRRLAASRRAVTP